MDFLSLPVPVLIGPDYLKIPKELRATHIALLAFCAMRENGGVIEGAAEWEARDWDRLAGTSRREVDQLVRVGLAAWEIPENTCEMGSQVICEGSQVGDLRVAFYPERAEAKRKQSRAAGSLGGQSRKSLKKGSSAQLAGAWNGEGEGEGEGEGDSQVRGARDPSPEAVAVAELLARAIKHHSPTALTSPAKWACDVDLAMRRDGRTAEQLWRAIAYAHLNPADDFWRANIRSGRKLRDKFDTLMGQADRKRFAAPPMPLADQQLPATPAPAQLQLAPKADVDESGYLRNVAGPRGPVMDPAEIERRLAAKRGDAA